MLNETEVIFLQIIVPKEEGCKDLSSDKVTRNVEYLAASDEQINALKESSVYCLQVSG